MTEKTKRNKALQNRRRESEQLPQRGIKANPLAKHAEFDQGNLSAQTSARHKTSVLKWAFPSSGFWR